MTTSGKAVKVISILALLIITVTGSGCKSLFNKNDDFVVSDSQLNWMTVKYYPVDKKSVPYYLNILAAGSIEIKSGFSPRVFNAMSQDLEHKAYDDIIEDTIPVPKEYARAFMQSIVDAGFLDEPSNMKSKKIQEERQKNPQGVALISAKLNTEPYAVQTNNPEIIAIFNNFVSAVRDSYTFH